MSDERNRAMIRSVATQLARIQGTPADTALRDWSIIAAAAIAALRKAGYLHDSETHGNVVKSDHDRHSTG